MTKYRYKITFLDELNQTIYTHIMTLPIPMSEKRVIYQFEEDYYRGYGKEVTVTNVEKLDEK